MAGDADEELDAAGVEFLAVGEDADDVALQPPGGVVVRASTEASGHGGEVDRSPHFDPVSIR